MPHSPAAGPGRGLVRLIVDGDGRALSLRQSNRQPGRLTISAALPDESQVSPPSIGVTASSARHVAHEITRRLYPLHTQAIEHAGELAALKQAEGDARRTVADAVAGALPGAQVTQQHRRTKILWEHAFRPPGHSGPALLDSICVVIGPSGKGEVSVDASGHPDCVVPMLAAFATAVRTRERQVSGGFPTPENTLL
ncbi:hypothetical protein ACFH04_06750 [Streptomyces noboritoensis]|uniref:Uncharacterized protein n=1 Tax=Streptomyces noboritoensis TaxID=67337 RepID=A0ABV6TCB1_9ACTN